MFIRSFNAEDAHTFYKWYHDKRLYHFFRGCIQGASIQQCMKAPELLRSHIHIGFNDDGIPVGAVTLADTNPITRIYKLGLLTDSEFHHAGYGKDLLAYGLQWSFDTMCAHKVFAEVLESDTRTVRGVERDGWVREGVSRESFYLNGKHHNEVVFSILKSEFDSRKTKEENVLCLITQ